MNIKELKLDPVERIERASAEEVASIVSGARRPVIFSGLDDDLEFLQELNLDFFSGLDTEVPVQRPEPDGINYFVKYSRMQMSVFVERIKAGENVYIGAREIMTGGGERSDKDGLGDLASMVKFPKWLDRSRISTANLWIGAGNNRTLLHFDPWDGILMLAAGVKEFFLFPGTETPKMYPYSAFGLKAITTGQVLHCRVHPLDVQAQFQANFGSVQGGTRGTINAGEMIFIPAGFWHYVESSDVNIGINFFVHVKDRKLLWTEPLRTHWINANVTLWPARCFWRSKALAFGVLRYFFPKRTADPNPKTGPG